MNRESGIRKDGLNVTITNTDTTVHVLSLTTGRRFVMTDLIVDFADALTFAVATAVVSALKICDLASGANATAAVTKFRVVPNIITTTDSGFIATGPVVITGLQNGPEFATEVSVAAQTGGILTTTHGCWIGGYEY